MDENFNKKIDKTNLKRVSLGHVDETFILNDLEHN